MYRQDIRKHCLKARYIAQMVECLPRMQETLYSNPTLYKTGMVVHLCNPNFQKVEAGNQEFEVFLGYIVRLRPIYWTASLKSKIKK